MRGADMGDDLVPTIEKWLEPIWGDWCEGPVEPVLGFGALTVCSACFEEAARAWNGRR